MKKSKEAPIMKQIAIISVIMLISELISNFIPFPMPSSVIGLIILFVALCTKVIKLQDVEKLGTALTDNIGLLFVPAGISVMNSFDVLAQSPVLILLLIVISTILLIVCTGVGSQLILAISARVKATDKKESQRADRVRMRQRKSIVEGREDR
ncbi:antiholin-like murein hydrolase modulator LrgA [Bavariicoccus seileri]|uniref:antiholin-like murein hydrolase modulator LrgA n=1 Tax=Bavariicoccus seileri TaxID=549685 RepID=UPI003F90EBDC